MIRKAEKTDINRIMQIWLKVNQKAHSFIDKIYWKSNFNEVKKSIEQADVYIYEKENIICGFIGIVDSYIAGIFVDELYQSQGIGALLLNYVKALHTSLSLHVYEKNSRALGFYLREGFNIVSEDVDSNTGEQELELIWTADK